MTATATTTANIRALCADLLAQCDAGEMSSVEAIEEIRAALTQPKEHGLTEDQLDVTVIAIQALIPSSNPWDTHSLAAVDRGREILQRALIAWG